VFYDQNGTKTTPDSNLAIQLEGTEVVNFSNLNIPDFLKPIVR